MPKCGLAFRGATGQGASSRPGCCLLSRLPRPRLSAAGGCGGREGACIRLGRSRIVHERGLLLPVSALGSLRLGRVLAAGSRGFLSWRRAMGARTAGTGVERRVVARAFAGDTRRPGRGGLRPGRCQARGGVRRRHARAEARVERRDDAVRLPGQRWGTGQAASLSGGVRGMSCAERRGGRRHRAHRDRGRRWLSPTMRPPPRPRPQLRP